MGYESQPEAVRQMWFQDRILSTWTADRYWRILQGMLFGLRTSETSGIRWRMCRMCASSVSQ